jgi:FkbM family methyltransferase
MIEAAARHLPAPIKSLLQRLFRRSTAARPSHPAALSCIFASNDYGSYCVPRASHHRPAAQRILRGKVWERETIAFMREHCGKGDIIHAGTYFGDFLPGLAGGLGEGALIWAFEPNNESYRCASITVELNALQPRVKLTHAALGPNPGTVKISVLDGAGHPLGGGSHVHDQGNETVTQIALDTFIPRGRRVSILQLDVEGYEEQALRGSEQLIRRDKPILIIETVPAGDWFAKLLQDCGYTLKQKLGINSAFVAEGNRPV